MELDWIMLGVKLFGAPSAEPGINCVVVGDGLLGRACGELIDADAGAEALK